MTFELFAPVAGAKPCGMPLVVSIISEVIDIRTELLVMIEREMSKPYRLVPVKPAYTSVPKSELEIQSG